MDSLKASNIPIISKGIVANIPNSSILIFDSNLKYVFAEGIELEKRGYKAEDMIGKTMYEVLPDTYTYFEPLYKRAVGGENFQIKLDSRGTTYLVTFSCIRAVENGPVYGMAVTQNISNLIEVERELEHQKKLYENVIDGISAGIWHWPNVNEGSQVWSKKYYELLGYEEGEIEANIENFSSLIHPEDIVAAYDIHTLHTPEYPVFYIEYRLKNKTGIYKWYLASGKITFDYKGKPQSMVGSLIDINDRKVAEEELTRTTLKFSGIFNNASGYIALLDTEGCYLECSPSILALRRLDLPDVIGKPIWHIGETPIDIVGSAQLKGFVEEALKGNFVKGDVMFGSKVWGIRYLTITCKPIYDANQSSILYIIMEGHDITDITNAKNTLGYQKQQLEDFAYITSHNLRAPATNINMLVDLLRNNIEPQDKEEYLKRITLSSSVLIETIDTLAEVLKIRNSGSLVKDNNNLQTVFEKVKAELSGIIENAGAVFTVDFAQCAVIAFPKVYFKSIFVNMLTNSIKYADANRPPHISITAFIENGRPVLTFADNGIGIDLDRHNDKVFGLYKVFTKRKDAHGVGLFLVKSQVESQGGSIVVDSTLGKGTTFTITF
jgi:PAS domain S-box-containing protein